MKKIILLSAILLAFNVSLSQELNNLSFKSITRNGNEIFLFEKGKLKSFESPDDCPLFFEYNENGLVSEMYKLCEGVKDSRKVYEYNESGYIKKYSFFRGDKLIKEEHYTYEFNNKDYLITVETKDFQLRKGVKFHLIKNYEMKNEVLTFTSDMRMDSNKQKNKNIYTFEDGNLKKVHFGVGDKKYGYEMEYDYDENFGANAMLMKSIFGEKYFINSLTSTFPPAIRVLTIISNNNLVYKKVKSKGELLAIDSFEESKIEYNKELMPVRIVKKVGDKVKVELIIEYE